ncbi:uncharacterized protein Z518_11377 [Rhinocladiella mackenziei CBS 650.93]|uniref:Uncharacterized protein n=1 Tax=Rhinocladiella mackenziei CBS 650.93 TaxID=1442369 RepID=A0A0D2IRL2_9EURO|nr:uncharacterized protein Z518_11377 [Rhinocladiella mackenziei CBS 650.93]KIW99389.1 hypothetical protein Z518_11377 [Rhinocladiella mackenziei CBS 650.93]
MSRATSDNQLKFLLSCVRHSNNGRVGPVQELEHFVTSDNGGLISSQLQKNVALLAREQRKLSCIKLSTGRAKRYERLLKANGIHPNGSLAENSSPRPSATSERTLENKETQD